MSAAGYLVEDLQKYEIFACESEKTLNEWHRLLFDLFDEIQSKIEAYQLAGTATDDWVRRASGKVAFAKMAIRWTERRMAELGFDLPSTRGGREREMIRDLRRQLREAQAEIESLLAA